MQHQDHTPQHNFLVNKEELAVVDFIIEKLE